MKNMSDQLTSQEIHDSMAKHGSKFLQRGSARALLGRRRPLPRQPGWRAALEAMEAEDEIVRLLYAPGMSVSPLQAAAAVEFAVEQVRRYIVLDGGGGGRPVYRLRASDIAWLDDAAGMVTHAGNPPPAIMKRLDEITNAIAWDAAAVASLNAARWIVRQYEISKRLH
jgi:hypothetical protein